MNMQPFHNRRNNRAKWHNYCHGLYFITICTLDKKHFFGQINNGMITYHPIGKIAVSNITNLPAHVKDVEVVNYIVMPNHIHLILHISSSATSEPKGCLKPSNHSVNEVDFHYNSRLSITVRSLKSAITKEARNVCSDFKWQRGYHDHIIRDQRAFDNIMAYVDNNVALWHNDCLR